MPSTTKPRFLLETVGGVTVASFTDTELREQYDIEEVSEQLDNLADGLGLNKVVLNFREVHFMSSSMLGVLWKFAQKVKAAQGRLKLCCIAPHLRVVFKITQFDRRLEIYDEEAAALDSF